jgi:hypothetical protein
MVQTIGYQAIKAGYTVYYRSIFDLVRDFLQDEVLGQDNKILSVSLRFLGNPGSHCPCSSTLARSGRLSGP